MVLMTQRIQLFFCIFCMLIFRAGSLPAQQLNNPILERVQFSGKFPYSSKALIKAAGLSISKPIDRQQIAGYSARV